MIRNKFGELIFDADDVCDLLMQKVDTEAFTNMLIDQTVNVKRAAHILEYTPAFVPCNNIAKDSMSVEEFDSVCQQAWHMPDDYKNLDIAEYVLGLCTTQEQLQRVGEELMLYQERDLFDLLRYLKYLVDTMKEHRLIWGVGRGSSVASYVLYLLGVHRIDSMYYDLDVHEFLR
jgi:DNA polymerase III alpha subunit